jgi:hypothetical protein
MLRKSLTIHNAGEARNRLEELSRAVESANITPEAKLFLIDASSRTIDLWISQLSGPNARHLKSDQLLEGPGYRIILRARSSLGAFSTFRRALGLG